MRACEINIHYTYVRTHGQVQRYVYVGTGAYNSRFFICMQCFSESILCIHIVSSRASVPYTIFVYEYSPIEDVAYIFAFVRTRACTFFPRRALPQRVGPRETSDLLRPETWDSELGRLLIKSVVELNLNTAPRCVASRRVRSSRFSCIPTYIWVLF